MTIFVAFLTFLIVALASRQIGQFGGLLRLPLITGYIATGVFVGPFVLDIVHADVLHDMHFIDEVSLGIIAFAAGSELYLPELKGRLRNIASVMGGMLVATFTISSLGIYILTGYIPFTEDFPTLSRVAVSILAGTIMVARSPASAIAIISELRAKGPFTRTVLGVTVSIDVVIIILFAVNTALATILLDASSFNPLSLLVLALDLGLAFAFGYIIYRVLAVVLGSQLEDRAKIALMLLVGYGAFFVSTELAQYSEHELHTKILVEPLLTAMIGSFLITNYSPCRDEFARLLEEIGPVIYVLFFTFTGASLRLDILGDILVFALAISMIRLVGIMIGTFAGSKLAGEPIARCRIYWMCFVTQAGVALGLAREVADEFPQFGEEFATLIISVVVFNELVGPPFLKNALKRVGEAHTPEHIVPDSQRNAVIFGVGRHALALARQLQAHDWQVIIADLKHDDTEPQIYTSQDMDIRYLEGLDEEHIASLVSVHTDAAVAMMQNDDDNLAVLLQIEALLDGARLSVRLNDPANIKPFLEMGATVVNPTDAIITLLDQSVRTPQSTAIFMHHDPDHEIAQITITAPEFDHLPLHKLRLPPDVLVLNIKRDEHSIVPHGSSKLHMNDEVTLLGEPEHLRETTLRMGY